MQFPLTDALKGSAPMVFWPTVTAVFLWVELNTDLYLYLFLFLLIPSCLAFLTSLKRDRAREKGMGVGEILEESLSPKSNLLFPINIISIFLVYVSFPILLYRLSKYIFVTGDPTTPLVSLAIVGWLFLGMAITVVLVLIGNLWGQFGEPGTSEDKHQENRSGQE